MLETPPEQQWQQSQWPPKKSRKGLYIIFMTLAVILIGSCVVVVLYPFYSLYQADKSANDSVATYSAKQDATREVEEATQAVPIPTNASISFSGDGQQLSPGYLNSYEHIFRFQQGLAIFTFTHDGKADFMVSLRNTKGHIIYDLANATGSFDGSTAESIPNAGVYTVYFFTDGKWTATIEQPRPTTAPYTTSFHGKGQAATSLFRMNSGFKTIHMTYEGTSNLNVRLLDSNGNVVASLVSEIGTFHGSKVEDIHNDGIYLFDVEADGNWAISIQ